MDVTPVRFSPVIIDHWMGAAPRFREQRGVHIDAAVLRRMDKLAGKYLSVGDDYRKVCIERLKSSFASSVFSVFG